nr:hypothetical protein Iba_chr14aCG7300 [Ipomoea batatas]
MFLAGTVTRSKCRTVSLVPEASGTPAMAVATVAILTSIKEFTVLDAWNHNSARTFRRLKHRMLHPYIDLGTPFWCWRSCIFKVTRRLTAAMCNYSRATAVVRASILEYKSSHGTGRQCGSAAQKRKAFACYEQGIVSTLPNGAYSYGKLQLYRQHFSYSCANLMLTPPAGTSFLEVHIKNLINF